MEIERDGVQVGFAFLGHSLPVSFEQRALQQEGICQRLFPERDVCTTWPSCPLSGSSVINSTLLFSIHIIRDQLSHRTS